MDMVGTNTQVVARQILLHLVTSVPSWRTASREVAILTAVTDTCLTLLVNAPQPAMNMTTAVQTNTHATHVKKNNIAARTFHAPRFVTQTKHVLALAAIFQPRPLLCILLHPYATSPENNPFAE